MTMNKVDLKTWISDRIRPDEITKYMAGGKDFIENAAIDKKLSDSRKPDEKRVRDILAKSLAVQTLTLEETASLMKVEDPGLWEEMRHLGLAIKKKVYDNRIVTFAPLYLGNFCVNECLYCGFRCANSDAKRRILSMGEIEDEVKVLAGEIGHKRLIAVYGEHPRLDVNYMVESIKAMYGVKVKVKKGYGQIRRVNVNAPPMPVEELVKLREAGLGTYQVFQETYNRSMYEKLHPGHTIKGNYQWRLYSMHRAMEAEVDDVGLGALFGLYDWRYEIMGLVAHTTDLEARFGIGCHTISFPRLEPANNAPYTEGSRYKVSDEDFKKMITVIRLAVPHTGLIITARETARMRREAVELGITQTDASTKIGVGSYSDGTNGQEDDRQQFTLGDTRSLDELIREFSGMGYITSFCTAGYRCGRTGKCIMELLRNGKEGHFCKLNAVLTFREWLDDFASDETKKISEPVIEKEIADVKAKMPEMYPRFMAQYERIMRGERDLYF